MPFSLRQARNSFLSKGFKLEPGGNHEMYYLYVNDVKTSSYARLSRRNDGDDLRDYEIGNIRETIQVPTNQHVKNFIACTLSADALVTTLRNAGVLRLVAAPPPEPPIRIGNTRARRGGRNRH